MAQQACMRALNSGQPVSLTLGGKTLVTFYPDGSTVVPD
jgi:hypothetical protein